MRSTHSIVALGLILGGCSQVEDPILRLAADCESIDPRVQPVRPMNDRPVKPALAAQLSALVDEARFGNAAFQPVIATAERLAASAGAAQSESWIVAQEALTTAIAARSPTANAQGDIDAIGASALQNQGGIAPNDLRAIDGAADEVATIARNQTDRIDAIKKRLGL